MADYVKVFIPFDMSDREVALAVRGTLSKAPKFTGLDSSWCGGENPWAEPTEKEDEFVLANHPVHPHYRYMDRVRVEEINGRRTVVGKVET